MDTHSGIVRLEIVHLGNNEPYLCLFFLFCKHCHRYPGPQPGFLLAPSSASSGARRTCYCALHHVSVFFLISSLICLCLFRLEQALACSSRLHIHQLSPTPPPYICLCCRSIYSFLYHLKAHQAEILWLKNYIIFC